MGNREKFTGKSGPARHAAAPIPAPAPTTPLQRAATPIPIQVSPALAMISFVLLASTCFGVGVAQDYPPYVEMLEGQQATYAIRVLNALNETVAFSIEPVSGMGLVTIIDAAPSYELAPKAKKEIKFLVVAPEGSAGRYEPTFIVNESKKDNPDSYIDTSISPRVSFHIRILPRPQANASAGNASTATATGSEPPAGPQAGQEPVFIFALATALLAAAALFLLANKLEAERAKAGKAGRAGKGRKRVARKRK